MNINFFLKSLPAIPPLTNHDFPTRVGGEFGEGLRMSSWERYAPRAKEERGWASVLSSRMEEEEMEGEEEEVGVCKIGRAHV